MVNLERLQFEMCLVDTFHEEYGAHAQWSPAVSEAFAAFVRLRDALDETAFEAHLKCSIEAINSLGSVRGSHFPQAYDRAVYKHYNGSPPQNFDIPFAYTWFLYILLDAELHQAAIEAAHAAWEEYRSLRTELKPAATTTG